MIQRWLDRRTRPALVRAHLALVVLWLLGGVLIIAAVAAGKR